MSEYNSPALARFEQLLADQRQFTDFLEKVNASVEETTGEFEMNNPYPTTAEIDANLPELPLIGKDFILVRRGDGLMAWAGAGRFKAYESDRGFSTERAAIADASNELSNLDADENTQRLVLTAAEVTEGIHFAVDLLNHQYHWESIGPFEADGLCSEDGFERLADCAREAKETLALVSQLGVDAALAQIDLLALTMSRLYPSDRQAIADAVSVLPFARQWQSTYEMALNTRPMPEQYWPDND